MTTLYLVRHAQSLPLPAVAEPEWALSEHGRAQAKALVDILEPLGIRRLYSSPFRRCIETLQPFADATHTPLVLHDGLRERCLSREWIGDFREVWQRSWADLSFTLEGGESSLACRTRMTDAVEDIVRRHPGETVAIGSHGYSIGLFVTTMDPAFGIREASALRTPEILRLTHGREGFRWDRDFRAGDAFDAIATHFRQTPGIVA